LPPIVAPLFLDIKYQSHRLLCSLPVTRSCVVAAKYFSTLIFIFLVGGCYYANVLVLDLAYGGDPILLQQVSNFKVLCAVVYFVVFVISFILPAVFKTGIMGFIITFCCGYVLAMATTMRFYNLNRGDFMAHYTAAERFSDIVPVAGALFMLIVSAVSAVSFFSTKEF
ncbi:ABC-2 transporter permease, partial [candidate division KSB1 bacterium]|nr:ABC-2 transporter permease [candidate division KSB1 bacterium]